MSSKIRGVTDASASAAIELRKRQTKAEAVLRSALRNRRLRGLKFRRQHAVGPYVLDFYCAEVKLGIEIDGPIHETQTEQDSYRQEHVEMYGYRIIRFRNDDVFDDLDGVLARIAAACTPDQQCGESR